MRTDRIAYLIAPLLMASTLAHADPKWMKESSEIQSLLKSVSTVDGDLGVRFTKVGLRVNAVRLEEISQEDIKEDPMLQPGDVEISILTEGTPRSGDCKVLGSPTFIRRKGQFLPQDRTGMWLLTGVCAVPK